MIPTTFEVRLLVVVGSKETRKEKESSPPATMEDAKPPKSQPQQELDDVDDVLDCVPQRAAVTSTKNGAIQAFEQEVETLLFQGNYYFRLGLYEKAISVYNDALKRKPSDPCLLLSNRCAAYCKFSERLRKVPAALSEENALYGLDPMSLVQLALKDAEKLIKVQSDWPKAYFRKGKALVLLEQYNDAKDAFLTGLHLDPTSTLLYVSLQELTAEDELTQSEKFPSAKQRRAQLQRSDDFDCTLCLKLLYNPVTTPCGHSFCRACLMQAMDHGNKCPMCRTVLFVSPRTYPLSVTLNNAIQRNFAEEYAERKAESDAITLAANEILPLFVMDFVLPYEKMGLNIFEPRYRLMVRRIMEGNRRMGTVGLDPETGTVADVACEVEICECEALPDGRYLLEVEGRRRCQITKTWEQDGYRVGQVQWLQDDSLPDGSPEKEKVQRLAETAASLSQAWISHLQEAGRADRRGMLAEILMRAQGGLDTSDLERFSFWVANLVRVRSAERLQLLRITETKERLKRATVSLRAMDSQTFYVH